MKKVGYGPSTTEAPFACARGGVQTFAALSNNGNTQKRTLDQTLFAANPPQSSHSSDRILQERSQMWLLSFGLRFEFPPRFMPK